MSNSDQLPEQWSSDEFLEHAIVEAFVPSASEADLQELLEAWDGEVPTGSSSIVPFVEQRQFILLGKELPAQLEPVRTRPNPSEPVRTLANIM